MLPPRGKERNCQGSSLSHWTHILIKTFIGHFPSAKHYAKSFAHFIILDPHGSKCYKPHCTDEIHRAQRGQVTYPRSHSK